MPAKDVTLKVRLDKHLAARLGRLARSKGMTKSAAVREAIVIAERDLERQKAHRILVAQAEEDQRRLRGRRPPGSKFALR